MSNDNLWVGKDEDDSGVEAIFLEPPHLVDGVYRCAKSSKIFMHLHYQQHLGLKPGECVPVKLVRVESEYPTPLHDDEEFDVDDEESDGDA